MSSISTPRVARSREAWSCSAWVAFRGGSPDHRSLISVSTDTGRPSLSTKCASSSRCLLPRTRYSSVPIRTRIGPSRNTRTRPGGKLLVTPPVLASRTVRRDSRPVCCACAGARRNPKTSSSTSTVPRYIFAITLPSRSYTFVPYSCGSRQDFGDRGRVEDTGSMSTLAQPERLPKVRASELTGRSWLNTGGKDLSLQALRGKIVLLDFWTFCCINCLHVIDELRDLEERFADVLVTIGVHSPKFAHEADPDALAAAVERYDVAHPVLDDPELATWKAYTARAWPTLVLIDPEGYIVSHLAGEGHAPTLTALIESLIAEHEAKGTLHRGEGPYVPPEPSTELLKFPAKAVRLPSGNLLIADAGHHRLVEMEPDGETPVRFIGSGERGTADGDAHVAQFSEPNGLCLLPAEVAEQAGYDVVVADTVNNLLRGVDLASGAVTTVAGTGEQFMRSEERRVGGGGG